MIGIIVATKSESNAILRHLPNAERKQAPMGSLVEFELFGKQAVMLCGTIGKVAAATGVQYLIDHYKIDKIFNYGTCGGVHGEVELGEVYCVNKAVQYDFDLSEIDDCPIGALDGFKSPFIPLTVPNCADKSHIKSLATADRFTNSEETVDFIKKNFDCPLRDMEGGAIAQICALNDVDCIMYKGVSDYVGTHSASMYLTYAPMAIEKISQLLPELFKLL